MGGKTSPRHFAKKRTLSCRLRKPGAPIPPLHSGTIVHVRRSTTWAGPCQALGLCFGVGQMGEFFNPSLKFAPTGSQT